MIGPYECYACGKRTRGTRPAMLTALLADDDGRYVPVGPDCRRRIVASGSLGYLPTLGGPRLFSGDASRSEFLRRGAK